jgi:hypothetical protein
VEAFLEIERGGVSMRSTALAVPAIGVVASAVAIAAASASSAGSPYEPALDPASFTTTIDNPYFPLPVGRVLVYRGVKDGRTQVDRVTVTNRTKRVGEGITARVVTDVAKHGRTLLEKTADWYVQDRDGNVWYLGEATAAYLPSGKIDTSGSWEAGVRDAEPGIVMEARPQIPDAYRQEFLRGEAEDTAWIVGLGGSIRVPAGRFGNVLTSIEATRLEPDAYDRKIYARGIGIVREEALTGGKEYAELVSVGG